MSIRKTLEKHYKDVQDIEFTIEDGKLLHAADAQRQAHRRWPRCKFAVDMVKEKLIDWKTAVLRNPADQLDQLLAPMFDRAEAKKAEGDRDGSARRSRRGVRQDLFQRRPRGRSRREGREGPARPHRDVARRSARHDRGRRHSHRARRHVSSHAALVARQMGKVCVCGAAALEIDYAGKTRHASDGKTFKEGDYLSIDGTTGEVYAGEIETAPSRNHRRCCIDKATKPRRRPRRSRASQQLMKWCDKATRMSVRTNADTPEQTANAIAFGAEGIGLCRTEHMFFEATASTRCAR